MSLPARSASPGQLRQYCFLEILQTRSAPPNTTPTREQSEKYLQNVWEKLRQINPTKDELFTNIHCAIWEKNESATESLVRFGMHFGILTLREIAIFLNTARKNRETAFMANAVYEAGEQPRFREIKHSLRNDPE